MHRFRGFRGFRRVQRVVVSPDGDKYEDSVKGLAIVSLLLHSEEPEPPSPERGWRRRRRRIGASSFQERGLKFDGALLRRFLGLTGPWPEGCSGRCAAVYRGL